MSVGRFVWHDLMTQDPAAATGFYGGLFGWTFEGSPHGEPGVYQFIHDGQCGTGGVVKMGELPMPAHWIPYVEVADADATAARAKALGGAVHHGPFDIPDVGRMAVIACDQGAALSIIQMRESRPAPSERPRPNQFCWYTLSVPDAARAEAFFAALFGWTVATGDLGGGATQPLFHLGEQPVAGLMPKAAEDPSPPFWGLAVAVEDATASLGKAAELGAQVIMPVTPLGTFGKLAVFADPTGAMLSIFQPLF